jgi:hypothetical protein
MPGRNKETRNPRRRQLNLFYTYGTAHVEDNVARALIITLMNLTPVNLRLFINEVVLAKTRDKVVPDRQALPLFTPPDFEFDLPVTNPQQGAKDEGLTPHTGVLVGITCKGNQAPVFEATPAGGEARPAGLVSDSSNELSVLFESTLSDVLDPEQLQRRCSAFFDSTITVEDVLVRITWSDIAAFLDRLVNVSQDTCTGDPKERYVVTEFLEYLDFLGLVEFRSFSERDFAESNYEKLHKFGVLLASSLPDELGLTDYAGDLKFSFNGIPSEYIRLDFGWSPGLTCTVVCGVGNGPRARQLQEYIQGNRDGFRNIVQLLRMPIDPQIALSMRVHSYFYANRFRIASLGNIGGEFFFPEGFDRFCDTMTNPQLNSHAQLTRDEINERFQTEIERDLNRHLIQVDDQGRFPFWPGEHEHVVNHQITYGQYCSADISLEVPKSRLAGLAADELVALFGALFWLLRPRMEELQIALDGLGA